MAKHINKIAIFVLLSLFSLSACEVAIESVSSNEETTSSEFSSSEESTNASSNSSGSTTNTTYTITWKDDLGNTLLTQPNVAKGTTPSYGDTDPTKESTLINSYTFSHWTPCVVPATEDATYTAVFISTAIKYNITWLNDDESELRVDQVPYGDVPDYGSVPTKESTASTSYTFSHWNPTPVAVTQNATYTVVFTPSVREYSITWLNDDNSPLRVDQVAYGATPSYGSLPTKNSSAQYGYTFLHWDKDVVPVTGDATYKAVYSNNLRSYTVTWKDDLGNTLDTDVLNYGETPSYGGTDPGKATTPQYTYEFAGWSPSITPVTGPVTYIATFTPIVRQYDITWLDEDDNALRVDHVNYGATPSYGSTPTKASTDQNNYTFAGWSPAVTSVTGPATYKATFTPSTRAYNITWKNYNGSTIKVDSVNYGATPSYVGATPTKPDDSANTYTFNGWSPAVTSVTGDTSYTATFTSTPKPLGNKLPDTFYFSNNKNWLDVYAYAWNSDSDKLADWPGVKMTYFKKNPEGESVYTISGISNYANIIINNNSGEQSADFAYTSLTSGNNALYLTNNKNSKGYYIPGQWKESGTRTANYNFANQGQNILHCFDWSIQTIIDNLDDIADRGFNAIQTSPLQPVKDYHESYNDTNEAWWRFYQPVGLKIANSTTNILFNTDNGANELTTLCTEAAKRGIRVIVDVIVNHLADGTGNGGLSTQVAGFNSEIYNNYSVTLHNPYGKVAEDKSKGAIGITQCDVFGKDLNTANETVQTTVYNFLKSLIDCGVTGLRFDAAKHIETKYDAYCGSSFWENTLGAVVNYANSTYGRTIWSYGEIITPEDGGRSYQQYLDDAWFYAVTAQPGWYDLAAHYCVSWGESHDNYPQGTQEQVNGWYYDLAKGNNETNILYLVRPQATAPIGGSIGEDPAGGWKSATVKYANMR